MAARSSKRSRPPSRPEGARARSDGDQNPREGWEPEGGVPRYINFPAESDSGGRGPSTASIVGGFGLLLAAYFVAEASLASEPHPLHWLAAVAGGLVGGVTPIVIGRVFVRSR
jgi:hypothetical protein